VSKSRQEENQTTAVTDQSQL